ncbi:MAG: hypothetical protein K0R09_3212 [Clostridiales bacterium]|nr:hypothetical protein [Clostridiales bacterium]
MIKIIIINSLYDVTKEVLGATYMKALTVGVLKAWIRLFLIDENNDRESRKNVYKRDITIVCS